MDKYFLAKVVARERKHEIDHDLAVRHLLKEGKSGPAYGKHGRRTASYIALAVIVVAVLVFSFT